MFSPLLPPLISLAGAGLLLALGAARRPIIQHSQLRWIAACVTGLAGVTILISANVVGAPWKVTVWSSHLILTPSLALQANQAGRLLGLALVVATLAAILVTKRRQEEESKPFDAALHWALLLVTLAAGLVTLLPANVLTLILTWTALDGVVAAAWLLSTADKGARAQRNALLGWGSGAAATLLLWSATLPLQEGYDFQNISRLTIEEGWMGTALILAFLLRLAPFPFHLGRPLPSARQPALTVGLRILPLVAGIWPLAQIPSWEGMSFFSHQIITVLLLTGLVGSGLLVWLPSEDKRIVRWIVGGQAAIVALAALWVGPDAALAEGMVLILSGFLLIVYAGLEATTIESKVAVGVGMAALAGIPLTWGGDGRLPLYQQWLDGGWGLYLLVAAGAYSLLLGAAVRLLLRPANPPLDQRERITVGIGLMLPAFGLVKLDSPIAAADPIVWIAITIPIIVGAVLAWRSETLQPVQDEIEPVLGPLLSLEWLRRFIRRTGNLVGRAAQTVHEVLEGEGALLWVLILLALGWLLSTR